MESSYYHPFRSMRNVWMKTERRRKQDIKEFFTNIYTDTWDAPFILLTNTPLHWGDPKNCQHLLIDWHSYWSIKQQLEKSLHLNLPDVLPVVEVGTKGFDFEKKKFKSPEELRVFLDVLYERNSKLKDVHMQQMGRVHLLMGVDILKRGTGIVLALDIESWDRNQNYILEVGLTRWHVDGTQPLVTRHFILQENQDKRNGKLCPDNRDNFAFGESEVMSKDKIIQTLQDTINDNAVMWVFHNADAETKYLAKLGIPMTLAVVDTQCISYLIPGRSGLKIGLEPLLGELDLPSSHMHNAGNDAHCTMQAFLALVEKIGNEDSNGGRKMLGLGVMG